MIELELPGVPLSWRAPFVGSRGAWSVRTPIMGQLKDILSKLYKLDQISYAIAIDFIFLLPIPKSASKKTRLLMINGDIRPVTRKDRSNLLKLSEDVLQGVVMTDDCLIVDGRTAKYYSNDPKTIVRVYALEEYNSKFEQLWNPQS